MLMQKAKVADILFLNAAIQMKILLSQQIDERQSLTLKGNTPDKGTFIRSVFYHKIAAG